MFLSIACRLVSKTSLQNIHRSSFIDKTSILRTAAILEVFATPIRNMSAAQWSPPPPCKVGDQIADIDTPALIVDMDKIEKNLQLMPKYMEKFPGVVWRPHAKAHKCPALAQLQVNFTTYSTTII